MFESEMRLLTQAVQFVRRRPGEALLLARMAGWVLALSLLIKLLPLPRVMQLVTSQPRTARPTHSAERLAQLIDLLLGLNLFVFTPTCWKRAPVLQRYLALNGLETRILFGVRKTGGALLDGHAWLERDGRPVFEKQPIDYVVTYGYP
jgi:hypothetical protein